MSDIKIDHAKVIEKLLKQGFFIPESQVFSKKAVGGPEAKIWNRNSINIFPIKSRTFHGLGCFGFQLSYNIHKKGLLALTPMLYMDEPFNLEIIAEKHDGIFLSSRNADTNSIIESELANAIKLIDNFEELLESYKLRAITGEELLNTGKALMEARFNPMYNTHKFKLNVEETDPMQCFKISPVIEEHLKITKVKTLLDAYLVSFINFLSDEYISIVGYGYSEGGKILEKYSTRGNIKSEIRRFSFSHKLVQVLEDELPLIKDVRVFSF